MNKREDALLEALRGNADETERWKTFLKDNQTAKENLSMFQKRLSVEVMVPVGKKALMPGHLIHTNEVLVGHYQGYFSKCSACKAAEICDLRINMAEEHLKKLETELELWQNKLEKPYAEGVVPSGGEEREIIEEFNEDQEKLWREQHKLRLKEAKQKERIEREKELANESKKQKAAKETKEKRDEEIFKMLEDAEIMEELEEELEQLEVDEVNDETIRKLMSGQMYLPPEKMRVAHDATTKETGEGETPLITNIVKKGSILDTVPATNNNVVPNPDITENGNSEHQEDDEEPLPEEVRIIKEQAKFLDNEDQIGFYEYQIEIIRQKLKTLPLRNASEMDEKIRLLTVLEQLEELLDLAETAVGSNELAEQEEEYEKNEESVKESVKENGNIEPSSLKPKVKKGNQQRRISFASEDQTLEFCKNEAVTQMLPEKKEQPKRDVIKLDHDIVPKNNIKEVIRTSSATDKKQLIKSKVEQNLKFISETQSKHDFDLVNKILETTMGKINTLHIKFKHSQQNPTYAISKENKDSEIPGSHADFYDLFLKRTQQPEEVEPCTLFINSYDGEDQVRAPVLKESDRNQAFEDPKAEFSNPKSILRNHTSTEMGNHYLQTEEKGTDKKIKKSKKKATVKDEESMSAYNKVMNDVVEKPLTEPEPLPEGNYIDAHTPKRRVSRFKQMRTGKT